jgi:hypothetical protein
MKKSRLTGGSFNHAIDLLGFGHAGGMAGRITGRASCPTLRTFSLHDVTGRITGRAGTTLNRAPILHLLSGGLARRALREDNWRRGDESGRGKRDNCEFHCRSPWNYPTHQSRLSPVVP